MLVDIPGYEGLYAVSENGSVWGCKRKVWLKFFTDAGGYKQVKLSKWNVRKHFLVHRLVASAFLGAKPTPQHTINHVDGVKSNNRSENLVWCTASENMLHAWEIGLSRMTEAKYNQALTNIKLINSERARRVAAATANLELADASA